MRLLLPTVREDASGSARETAPGPRRCCWCRCRSQLARPPARTQPPPPPPLGYQSKRGGPTRSALCSLLGRTFQNLRHLLTGASTGPSTCHFRFLLLEPSRKILPNGRPPAPAGGRRCHGDGAAARAPLASADRACPASIPPSPPRAVRAPVGPAMSHEPGTPVAHGTTPGGSVRLPDAEGLLGRVETEATAPGPPGLPGRRLAVGREHAGKRSLAGRPERLACRGVKSRGAGGGLGALHAGMCSLGRGACWDPALS